MRIVSFLTQKGGTGKSTLAFNVAVAAAEAGETVALFDLDPQGMVNRWADVRAQRQSEAEANGEAKLAAALAEPHVEHVPPAQIAELTRQIKAVQGFSLIILDTKGEDSPAQRIAMQVATFNIVVMRPSRADADMSWPTIEALEHGKKHWASALTQCPAIPGNSRAPEMAAGLKKHGLLVEPLILSRLEYQDAYANGLGVTEQNPKGKAAEEMRTFWKSIDNLSKGKQ